MKIAVCFKSNALPIEHICEVAQRATLLVKPTRLPLEHCEVTAIDAAVCETPDGKGKLNKLRIKCTRAGKPRRSKLKGGRGRGGGGHGSRRNGADEEEVTSVA